MVSLLFFFLGKNKNFTILVGSCSSVMIGLCLVLLELWVFIL